jgi:hypothetical protein
MLARRSPFRCDALRFLLFLRNAPPRYLQRFLSVRLWCCICCHCLRAQCDTPISFPISLRCYVPVSRGLGMSLGCFRGRSMSCSTAFRDTVLRSDT